MDTRYKKRAGTSGISGQLYETKLIGLVLFRLLHDDSIEEFHLASNMDDVGAFDDICLRIKVAGLDRPVLAFVQAKHKDNEDTFPNFDLVRNLYSSYVKVRQTFYSSHIADVFFRGKFDETECLFILYTNAKYSSGPSKVLDQVPTAPALLKQRSTPHQSIYAKELNHLLATNDSLGVCLNYTNEDVQFVEKSILIEEIATLAEHFVKFLHIKAGQSMNIMNDEYILRYHVILAKSVVDISDIQSDRDTTGRVAVAKVNATKVEEWRTLKFRPEFFHTDDYILTRLREKIFKSIVKNLVHIKHSKIEDEVIADSSASHSNIDELISSFLSEPSALTLSPLIGTHVTYTDDKLSFLINRPNSDREKLDQINISSLCIDEAEAMAARTILTTLELKVPVTFGNNDLTIRGDTKKIERRLNYLTKSIVDLCEKSKFIDAYEIVTIDEDVGEGLLSANGGLGGTVGNLLVYDETTKLLMFVDDCSVLKKNARMLFDKLNSEINNLHVYRFDVKAIRFPKLIFDCTDEATEILSKLVIYERQSNHHSVGEILKTEIQRHQICDNAHNFSVKSDTMFVTYHQEIQKWWMSHGTSEYLTRTSDIYRQATSDIVIEPQITLLQNTFYMNKLKYFGYRFSDSSMNSLNTLETTSRIIINADIPTLTTIKVIQCLKNKYINKYAILDFECILNLPAKDFAKLNAELLNTAKTLIVVCDVVHIKQNRALHRRLDELAQVTENKTLIVISNDVFAETAKEYFLKIDDIVSDVKPSFVDLSAQTQNDIMGDTHVTFQGQDVSLNLLVDDVSIAFIKGVVFDKILRNENIVIGAPLSNANYDDIKHLYVDRRVSQAPSVNDMNYQGFSVDYTDRDRVHLVKTFDDVDEDVVLITAAPAMGKSTLLTHLSLNTKEKDRALWIVRTNLLEHSKQFYNWEKDKTIIDTLETLKFLCRVVLTDYNISVQLKETNGKMYLEGCSGDELQTFELNMFLHFYNKRKLLLLFDGFDEICPHYKDKVIMFLDVVKNDPRKNKMWVTSRPYSEILPDLERVLGKSYEVEFIAYTEQNTYLKNFWRHQLVLEKLTDVQRNNVKSFLTSKSYIQYGDSFNEIRFQSIYNIFYVYVYSLFPHIDSPEPFDIPMSDTDTTAQDNTTFSALSFYNRIIRQVDKLLGTPLLLYLVADHFVNLICVNEYSDRWYLDISMRNIYDMFIENKLKKIQVKNKMDVYNPDVIMKYEKERTDCLNMHKKLGAYVIFGSPLLSKELSGFVELKNMMPFNEEGSTELEDMINKIKSGKEKTGLISHVAPDNVPVFVHRTFAEYFTAEYVCDVLKSSEFEFVNKVLLYCAINLLVVSRVIRKFIIQRTAKDEELAYILAEIESNGPPYMSSSFRKLVTSRYWSREEHVRFMSSSLDDYESDCFDGYREDYLIGFIHSSDWREEARYIREIKNKIMSKMKPHLKKHFTVYHDDFR